MHDKGEFVRLKKSTRDANSGAQNFGTPELISEFRMDIQVDQKVSLAFNWMILAPAVLRS
jgi:hypothetical protein